MNWEHPSGKKNRSLLLFFEQNARIISPFLLLQTPREKASKCPLKLLCFKGGLMLHSNYQHERSTTFTIFLTQTLLSLRITWKIHLDLPTAASLEEKPNLSLSEMYGFHNDASQTLLHLFTFSQSDSHTNLDAFIVMKYILFVTSLPIVLFRGVGDCFFSWHHLDFARHKSHVRKHSRPISVERDWVVLWRHLQ